MDNELSVGDLVECVNAEGTSLVKHQCYTVDKRVGLQGYVYLVGIEGGLSAARFRRIGRITPLFETPPYRLVQNESVLCVDVDNTLVIWGQEDVPGVELISVANPLNPTDVSLLRPHNGHIKILKDRYLRGSHVTVWSAGGYRWAEAVVKALKLERHVDIIMTKPFAYIDDKEANEWMGEHIYLAPDDTYGSNKKRP